MPASRKNARMSRWGRGLRAAGNRMEAPADTPPETPPAELTREVTAPDLGDPPCSGPFSPRQSGLAWDGAVGRTSSNNDEGGRTMSHL